MHIIATSQGLHVILTDSKKKTNLRQEAWNLTEFHWYIYNFHQNLINVKN